MSYTEHEGMPPWAVEANDLAEFHPRMTDDELPEVVVAGVAVTVYVDKTGTLRVSVHTDTGEADERLLYGEDECVRLRITVNGSEVYAGSDGPSDDDDDEYDHSRAKEDARNVLWPLTSV